MSYRALSTPRYPTVTVFVDDMQPHRHNTPLTFQHIPPHWGVPPTPQHSPHSSTHPPVHHSTSYRAQYTPRYPTVTVYVEDMQPHRHNTPLTFQHIPPHWGVPPTPQHPPHPTTHHTPQHTHRPPPPHTTP